MGMLGVLDVLGVLSHPIPTHDTRRGQQPGVVAPVIGCATCCNC